MKTFSIAAARTVALCATIVIAGVCSEPLGAQEGFTNLPGVRLHFTDTGGAGTPIVFLHANTGTAESWKYQIEPFSKAGYRVIAFDRRGWGKSVADPATGSQPGTVADDLQALVDYLNVSKFYVVGVAGGGFVALDYAAWQPSRVIALVVAASTGLVSEREVLDYSARIAIPGFDSQPGTYREISPSYRGSHPDGVLAWAAIEEHSRQAGAPNQPLRTPNTFAKLESIRAPVLVLAADADLIAPPGLMKAWAAHVNNGQYDSVPDAGHAVAWERPEIFNERVLRFLRAAQAR